MKKLSEIIDCQYDIEIEGICDDSRLVKSNYLFVATKGFNVDHFDYINDAIERGAVAVICDRDISLSVPSIVVEDVLTTFISCCERFYDVFGDDFNFIGITGTDGKTTVATLVKELIDESFKTAYIGTNGVSFGDFKCPTNNTTPCINELYRYLLEIKKYGCKDVSMEVSSEALLHKRVNNIKYDIVAYTNITEDHLNIHKSIDNYINTKLTLCELVKDDGVIFTNGDDKNCKLIKGKNVYSYGFSSDNYYVIYDVKEMSNFVKFRVRCKDFDYSLESPLIGKFNIYNVVLAFIIGLHKGIDFNTLIYRIKKLKFIEGRMECLNFFQKYKIILDYAHTYNSIKNVLDCFSSYKRIILVTGAAGGREKEKRSKIGTLILSRCSFVIFTMDDPRYESPYDIALQMIGNNKSNNYEIEVDRHKAIFKAFAMAEDGDIVLILGKGRDNYMAIGDKKLPYCDYDVIKDYFS